MLEMLPIRTRRGYVLLSPHQLLARSVRWPMEGNSAHAERIPLATSALIAKDHTPQMTAVNARNGSTRTTFSQKLNKGKFASFRFRIRAR